MFDVRDQGSGTEVHESVVQTAKNWSSAQLTIQLFSHSLSVLQSDAGVMGPTIAARPLVARNPRVRSERLMMAGRMAGEPVVGISWEEGLVVRFRWIQACDLL